jgi:hypothetical protein
MNLRNLVIYFHERIITVVKFSTDNNPFTMVVQPTFTAFNERLRNSWFLGPKYRFNDKFSLAYSEYTKINNDRGWLFDDAMIYRRHQMRNSANDLTGKYSLNNK